MMIFANSLKAVLITFLSFFGVTDQIIFDFLLNLFDITYVKTLLKLAALHYQIYIISVQFRSVIFAIFAIHICS